MGDRRGEGGRRTYTLAEHARGLLAWSTCLEKGVLPLEPLESDSAEGADVQGVQWPSEPLRALLLGAFAKLKLPQLSSRFPQIHKACVSALLDAVIEFEREFGKLTVVWDSFDNCAVIHVRHRDGTWETHQTQFSP